MTNTINYKDFEDKDVVSGLKRGGLLLNNSQFSDLPSNDIVLTSVKISKINNKDDSTDFKNVKLYKFEGKDKGTIDGFRTSLTKLGLSKDKLEQIISNVPKVKFEIALQNSQNVLFANAKDNFDFVTGNALDTTPVGKELKGIKWGITWKYLDQYHDVLSLVIPDCKGVKVQDVKA